MKQFLTILLLGFTLSIFAQTSPPQVIRSSPSLTQVDPFLVASRRLGIPTSASDDLNATSVLPANCIKILYNTSLQKLRVYDPVEETWKDAIEVDFSPYYTAEEVDDLLSNYYTKGEIDDEFSAVYDELTLYYLKTEVDDILADYYTIGDIDNMLEDYVPLVGVTETNPITGPLISTVNYDPGTDEPGYAFTLLNPSESLSVALLHDDLGGAIAISNDANSKYGILRPDGFNITNFDDFASFEFYYENFVVNSSDPLFQGLKGLAYYGANYDDNTYIQKKYVDEAFIPLSGTSAGNRMTNDFELTGNKNNIFKSNNTDWLGLRFIDSSKVELFYGDKDEPLITETVVSLSDGMVEIYNPNEGTFQMSDANITVGRTLTVSGYYRTEPNIIKLSSNPINATTTTGLVFVDPPSTISGMSLRINTTEPTWQPGYVLEVVFGGQITSGNVYTGLTFQINSSDTIIGHSIPSTVSSGDILRFIMSETEGVWYHVK